MPFQFADDPRSVTIEVRQCAITGGDVGYLADDESLVVGHQAVGTITEVGPKVTTLEIGDRVGVGYQIWSCGYCEYCTDEREHLCQEQVCQVEDVEGALAGIVVADERFVFKLDDEMSGDIAAVLMCSGATAHAAAQLALAAEPVNVVVVGAGGVGHLVVQALSADVMTLVATKRTPAVIPTNQGPIDTVGLDTLQPRSFDVVIYTSTTWDHFTDAVSLARPDGLVIMVGSPSGPMPIEASFMNFQRERDFVGSYIASPAMIREMLETASFKPIIQSFEWDQRDQAIAGVRTRSVPFTAIVTR